MVWILLMTTLSSIDKWLFSVVIFCNDWKFIATTVFMFDKAIYQRFLRHPFEVAVQRQKSVSTNYPEKQSLSPLEMSLFDFREMQ